MAGYVRNVFSRRASFLVALVIAVLFCADLFAKPPQAPPIQPTKSSGSFTWAVISSACADCPCGVPDCPCGCCSGKACTCKSKRVGDELSKPYAKAWIADGWTWHADKGYWTKMPVQEVQTLPAQFYQPSISYQPPMQQMFMPSYGGGGFGGGMRMGGGGGGRSGGC